MGFKRAGQFISRGVSAVVHVHPTQKCLATTNSTGHKPCYHTTEINLYLISFHDGEAQV